MSHTKGMAMGNPRKTCGPESAVNMNGPKGMLLAEPMLTIIAEAIRIMMEASATFWPGRWRAGDVSAVATVTMSNRPLVHSVRPKNEMREGEKRP